MRYSLLIGFMLLSLRLYAQEGAICGKLTDAVTGMPIPMAHVELHETEQRLVTDTSGVFCYDKLILGNSYHVHFSFLGYESSSKTVRAGLKSDTLLILLKPTSFLLPQFTLENEWTRTDADRSSLNVISIQPKPIERANANNFSEILEKVPGIRTMNTGVGIAKPVIRGMYGSRVMVNENGVRQEGQQWGLDHGLEIDAFNTGRIEVIKGAASMLYGSGANAGVVNILPSPVPSKNTFNSEIVSGYRSNNNMYMGSAMTEGNKNNQFFKVRVSYRDYADYRVPADSFLYNNYVLPLFDNTLKNTAGKERSGSISGGLMRDWGVSRITISAFNQVAGLFPGAIGIPRFNDIKPDGDNRNIDFPRQEITHLKLLSNTNINFKQGWLQLDLGWQYNQRFEMSPAHSHGFTPYSTDNLALGLILNTGTANAKYHRQVNEKLKVIGGGNVQWMYNEINGFEFLIPQYTQLQTAAFAFVENNFSEKFTLNAAVRFDRVEQHLHDFKRPVYGTGGVVVSEELYSPQANRVFTGINAGLGAVYIPVSHWNIKVNLSRVYRVPDVNELASNGVHHGTFRHEMGTLDLQAELGYQADMAVTYKKEKIILQLTPFANYYQSYIYLQPQAEFSHLPDAGQIYRYVQHPVFFGGGEFLSEVGLSKEWSVLASAEYVLNYNTETYLPLPFTPPFNASTALKWSKKREHVDYNARISHRYFSDANRVDRNESPTPGYHITAVQLGAEIPFKKQSLELALTANNLFDVKYMNHLSRYRILNLPEQGRNISVLVKWTF